MSPNLSISLKSRTGPGGIFKTAGREFSWKVLLAKALGCVETDLDRELRGRRIMSLPQ